MMSSKVRPRIIPKESIFLQSFPLLITQFVNQSGDIGLSLLPMLLVARQIESHASSWIMTGVKAGVAIGILLGGWLADRLGLRATLLVSLFVAAVGMGILPFSNTLGFIAGTALMAQIGQAMFQGPARMLLCERVSNDQRSEALAWLRVANNAGAMVVFWLGGFYAGVGFTFLMLFDSSTSWIAWIAGLRFLPFAKQRGLPLRNQNLQNTAVRKRLGWRPFLSCTFVLAGYSFIYNFFYVSFSARLQLRLGAGGISFFARLMLLSTLMCAVLSVPVARLLGSKRLGLSAGTFIGLNAGVGFVTFGSFVALAQSPQVGSLYAGIILLTLGEIFFNAVAQPALLNLIPASLAPGRAHALGLIIQSGGRVLGAAAAFPLAIYGDHWGGLILGVTLVTFLLGLDVSGEFITFKSRSLC